jgi:dCTP diphosphatase
VVEQRFCKPLVGSSNLSAGTFPSGIHLSHSPAVNGGRHPLRPRPEQGRRVILSVKACQSPYSVATIGAAMEIEEIRDELRRFAAERQWDQFHSPKNLATAVTVEAAELLEHFQWLTDDESLRLDPEVRDKVVLEMADVFLYLVRLADKLNANLIEAARRKLAINAKNYPVSVAKGNAKKYTEF